MAVGQVGVARRCAVAPVAEHLANPEHQPRHRVVAHFMVLVAGAVVQEATARRVGTGRAVRPCNYVIFLRFT